MDQAAVGVVKDINLDGMPKAIQWAKPVRAGDQLFVSPQPGSSDKALWDRAAQALMIKTWTDANAIVASVEKLVEEYKWVRSVLAEHGYDGPLGEAVCPLREMLKDQK